MGGRRGLPFPSSGEAIPAGLPAHFRADLGGQGWHRLGRGYYLPSCTSLFITCLLFFTFCIFHCEKRGGERGVCGGSDRQVSGSWVLFHFGSSRLQQEPVAVRMFTSGPDLWTMEHHPLAAHGRAVTT